MKIKPLEIFTIKRIFDFIKIPIFAIDTDREILMWNTSMAEFSNIPANKVIGKRAEDIAEKIYPNSNYFLSDYFINTDIKGEIKDIFEIVEFDDHIVGIPKCIDKNYLIIKASPLFDKRERLIGAVELIMSFDGEYKINSSFDNVYDDKIVYIVSKHKNSRSKLKNIVTKLGINDVREFDTGSSVIAEIFKLKPNLLVLDLSISEIKGERIVRAVKDNFPDIKIAVWGKLLDESLKNELKSVGVEFFIEEPFNEDKVKRLLIYEDE